MPSKDKKSRKQPKGKKSVRRSRRKTLTMKMINDLSQKVDILLKNVETKFEIDSTIQLGDRLIKISQTSIDPLRYTFKIDEFEEIVVENEGDGFVMKSPEDMEDSDADEETPSISSESSEDVSETSEPSEEESTNTSSEEKSTEASEPTEEESSGQEKSTESTESNENEDQNEEQSSENETSEEGKSEDL